MRERQVLVILVLVIVWVAVLTPRAVRHFKEAGAGSSVDSFREELHRLGSAGSKFIVPAHRLVTESDEAGVGRFESMKTSVGPVDRVGTTYAWSPIARSPQTVSRRRRSAKRRRDLLLGLLAVAVVTGLLGAMHALHLLWAITGVSVLALGAYVALVAYAQSLAAEREPARRVTPPPPAPITPAWLTASPHHAAGGPMPGVAMIAPSKNRVARAGYPGGWDEDDTVVPRHAVVGVR